MSLAKPTPRERAKPTRIGSKCGCSHRYDQHDDGGRCMFNSPVYPQVKFCHCEKFARLPRVSLRRSPIQRASAPIKRKTKVRKQRKTGRAALARLADKLCGQIVRMKGRCENCGCGAEKVLQWAHGFSRRYHATRWLPLNGFCLCSGCHFKYGLRPLEWDNWLRLVWGPSVYDELRRLALKNERVDLAATVAALRAELARMEG